MYSAAQLYFATKPAPFFGRATIIELDYPANTARLLIDDQTGMHEIQAQIALSFGGNLQEGDEVLLAGNDSDSFYIIGILNQHQKKAVIHSKDGSSATLHEAEGTSLFQICSDSNELLIEYDSQKKTARIFLHEENVEFFAPKGNITFSALKTIQFEGERIQLKGRSEINLTTSNSCNEASSSLSLKQYSSQLNTADITITAKQGRFYLDALTYIGKSLSSKIKGIRLTAEKIETTAVVIMQKARNIYSTVEHLTQLKTGRLRNLIDSTYHLKSKKMILKAEEDVKIQAEKIHLG
jgi:hypothetical protein